MSSNRLRLITFDVTNTLLKFRNSAGGIYSEIGAMHGVHCDNKALTANFKLQFRRMNEEHPNYGLRSGLGWENWWKCIVLNAFKDSSNVELEEEKLTRIAESLINVYKTSTCWRHSPGAFDLLSYIRYRRIPMGIISNFDPRLDQILINLKLKHYFQFVLTSYEIGVLKPDREIFEKAMYSSKVPCLKHEECLHVGDTLDLDYLGAINSGWNGALIHVNNPKGILEKHPQINPKHVFNGLQHLHAFLVQCSGEKIFSQRL